MKNFLLGILATIGFIIGFAAIYAISWIATCGIIALICLCFGWTFNWLIATGVWLVILLLRSIFRTNVTVRNRRD